MVLLHDGKVRIQGSPEEIKQSDDPVLTGFLEGRAENLNLIDG
jgi:ABC-type transporter Mla maintaining outer membrane lipid asymmetry ATPase subunit MlaF